jgi:exodeoxyribonuclease VII large subunit
MPVNDPTQTAPHAKIWTVSELNRMLKELIEQTFYPFWVRGEISNLTIHRSGHVYFSLKDSKSQVSAVFFRGAAKARQLQLREGMAVEAWGRLGVYEPRGTYQLNVQELRPIGIGTLQQQFELLKQKLAGEGLFDAERKRPIPAFPRCVGVVTSPQGAAIRDFLRILEGRFANMHVRICPAAVQGQGAASQIAGAIHYLNETRACDVIVVTRGGGSLEDLWPFNEEIVARAIAASRLPVISAVGHEVDFTIADFVADLRVATPSAAAEQVIAKKAELQERLQNLKRRLGHRLSLQLSDYRRRVQLAAHHRVFQEPGQLVRLYQQRLDELCLRLSRALKGQCQLSRARVGQARAKLEALSPHQVLERGYAILQTRKDERVVFTESQVAPGDLLRATLAQGSLHLQALAANPEDAATATD